MDKRYRPGNGTEGENFMHRFCYRCIQEKHTHTGVDGDKQCPLIDASMSYSVDDDKYPSEWTYDDNGEPVCTTFVKWDWGMDEDGNWNDPVQPELEDPNQLVLPFLMDEISKEEKGINLKSTGYGEGC